MSTRSGLAGYVVLGVIGLVGCGGETSSQGNGKGGESGDGGGGSTSGGSAGASGSGSSGKGSGGDTSGGKGGEPSGGQPMGGASGASGGSGQGGNAGMGGSSSGEAGSSAGSGEGGDAGAPQGGQGGQGGRGGSAGQPGVEYRGCEIVGGYSQINLYRIDRAGSTCTLVTISDDSSACMLGITSGIWCLTGATTSADVAACERGEPPSGAVAATSASGTFSVGARHALDIDVSLQFPASGSLPRSVRFQAMSCATDCAANDCRN